jgi:hypothetical protein
MTTVVKMAISYLAEKEGEYLFFCDCGSRNARAIEWGTWTIFRMAEC